MEMTTPPNVSGLGKKPSRKFKKPTRGRKSGKCKPAATPSHISQIELLACLCGSALLLRIAGLLAPMFIEAETSVLGNNKD